MKRKHLRANIASLPNAGMAAVAGMIADPGDFPVVRKSGTYSTMPTATAKPYIREAISWDPTAVNDVAASLPATDWGGFIFRNPMRAAVIYKRFSLGTVNYHWHFNPQATEEGEQGAARDQQFISVGMQTDLFPYGAQFDPGNPYNPHGEFIYSAEDDGYRYIWIDGDGTNASIQFTITWSTATTIVASRKVYIYKWDGGIRRLVTTSDSGAIGTTIQNISLLAAVSTSGYYGISVFNDDTASALVQVRSGSTNQTDYWAHLTASQLTNSTGLGNNIVSTQDIRVLGASILVQNKAGPLTRQGKSVICQALKSEDWYSFYGGPGQTMYNRISSNPSARSFNWEDGIYGFLKPTGETDLDWIQPYITVGTAGQIEDTTYPLIQSDYLAFCVSATVAGAGDAQYTIHHALEYRTRNQWIEIMPPIISSEEWEAGVQAVISMEQFYHNPIHWAKIFATIGKLARVGAPILAKFGPYGAMASSVMGVIGEALK